MKQRHHTPVQVIRKLVEGEKLLAQGETTEETDPFFRATDATCEHLVDATVEEYGHVDVLVNNGAAPSINRPRSGPSPNGIRSLTRTQLASGSCLASLRNQC